MTAAWWLLALSLTAEPTLVSGDLDVLQPAVWLADGRLAFLGFDGAGRLWQTVAVDGTDLAPLLPSPAYEAAELVWWSPTGDRYAYVGRRGDERMLFVQTAGDEEAKPFSVIGKVEPPQVAWSPDGQRLAFSRRATERVDTAYEIFVLGADGTGPMVRIPTENPAGNIVWSRESRHLACVLRGGDWRPRLYVALNLVGAAVVCSSYLQVLPSSVAWAYGGKQLSFSGSGAPEQGYRLFLQRADGRLSAQQVRLPGYLDGDPAAWSPDGQWLAWHAGPRSQPSRGHVYLASTDTPGTADSLTRGLAGGLEPRFSADSRWLSYTAVDDFAPMRSKVVLLDPWHREEQREIDLGQVTSGAVFSPDSTKVAVLAGDPDHLRLYVEAL